ARLLALERRVHDVEGGEAGIVDGHGPGDLGVPEIAPLEALEPRAHPELIDIGHEEMRIAGGVAQTGRRAARMAAAGPAIGRLVDALAALDDEIIAPLAQRRGAMHPGNVGDVV